MRVCFGGIWFDRILKKMFGDTSRTLKKKNTHHISHEKKKFGNVCVGRIWAERERDLFGIQEEEEG